MNKRHLLCWLTAAFLQTAALAAEKNTPGPGLVPAKEPPPPIREIYVPFEDLNVVLDSDRNRVFLTRTEYEELLAQAKVKPTSRSPLNAALVAAQYEGRLENGRAIITGELTFDVMAAGMHTIPLDLGGVGIRSALLDGRPAPLARPDDLVSADEKPAKTRPRGQSPLLILEGRGQHQLKLELTAPLATSAAQQSLQVRLPTTVATRLVLSIAGDVELKAGAAVKSRQYDPQAHRTRLEVLPERGGLAVVMSLNNRLLKDESVMVASSVIIDEVTQGYERIHATISYRVLHGAVDKLRIGVPSSFETTSIDSVKLARWEEKTSAAGRKTVEVTLREPTSEQVVVHLVANRSPSSAVNWLAELSEWAFPIVEPQGTAGQVAAISLAAEDRLRAEQIAATGLLPIDSTALAGAIPASIRQAEPGAPTIRQIVSYYAPAGDYSLSAAFVRPPAEVHVASNSLLVIGDHGLKLQGGLAISPLAESLHALHLRLPAGWQLTSVIAANGSALPLERYEIPAGGTRVAVRLPSGIRPGQSTTLHYEARQSPAAWLADWTTQRLTYPRVTVEESTHSTGAIATHAVDDLLVRPAMTTGLTPIVESELATFGLSALPTALAFRIEQPDYSADLVVERISPSITARNFAFVKLGRDHLLAHYELIYDIREARARQLAFSLPLSTPTELSVQGLDGIAIKEVASQDDGDRRRWTVRLAERQIGSVRLAVDFSQAASYAAALSLPLARAEDVEYQSALVAIEADPELEVNIAADARRADIGELSGANYQLGRHVVGTYGFVGDLSDFQATVVTPQAHPLQAALIERVELVTKVSTAGLAQSVVRYDLLAKGTLIEARLPADAVLWSVVLDDRPLKPQRDGGSLLISLPAQQQLALRKLQIVYESPVNALAMTGRIETTAPALYVRTAGRQAAREIPQADLKWQLVLPSGYIVARTNGTLDTDEIAIRQPVIMRVGRWLFDAAGGVRSPLVGQASRLPPPASAPTATTESTRGIAEAKSAQAMSRSLEALADQSATAKSEPARAIDPFAAPLAVENKSAQQSAGEPTSGRDVNAGVEFGAVQLSQLAKGAGLWALEGVSSLKIDIEQGDGPVMTFHSLGEQPRLSVVAVDYDRVHAAAQGLGLLVVLIGVGLTLRPVRERVTFVIVILAGTSLPLVASESFEPLRPVLDAMFVAGCCLIVWYLAAAIAGSLYRSIGAAAATRSVPFEPAQALPLLIAAALFADVGAATAQTPPPEDLTPVSVPADAIIIPYDAEKPDERNESGKILVPYAKYVELWNLAYPTSPLSPAPRVTGFAIAGTSYEATLAAGDALSLAGQMEIDVYGDQPITVPLRLARGVIEQMTVDGQPARLGVLEGAKPTGAERLFVLHLSGSGRKQVNFRLRLGLSRQGGWRIVQAHVPTGPAASLTLRVSDAGTEIRQSGLADRAAWETNSADEQIELALSGGALNLQWRPKVAAAMVDQALTVHSAAVLDVREDAVRLAWQLRLEFGRGQRDAFTLIAPTGYLIEGITGDNVRGWTAKTDEEGQRVDVTLLKSATGRETLTAILSRRGRFGAVEGEKITVPAIEVEGAALQQGEILVRHSPRLTLRTLESTGIARSEASQSISAVQQIADAADAALLTIQPYQNFHFTRLPFRLVLSAADLPQHLTATVRAALRVAERETTLDAAVTIKPSELPVYEVRLSLPADFSLIRLGPADLEWSLRPESGRLLLTVLLSNGRTEEFTLTLLGRVGSAHQPSAAQPPTSPRTLSIPRMDVLGALRQDGEIAILPDPDTDTRLTDLTNCEAAPIITPPSWMKPDQQSLAKNLLRFRSADYAATLVLLPRMPLVSARTITNIKVTPRSIEETLLVNFHIEQAGIRQVRLLIPSHLATARLKARLLKQKTIEPATSPDGQPLPGMVRLTLDLQDDVRGDFAVLLEHDRLLTAEKQTVAAPVILTGRTDRRLLAIENAGRDEVVIDPADALGVEAVHRQQQAWRDLASVLGEHVTVAYAAKDTTEQPRLSYSTLARERTAQAQARIGLATTLLIVDRAGTYRALVQYRVSSETEPYLQVALPESASLWTALVAGQPVKPAEAAPPRAGVVRIPLVKTAEGEGDYLVELKYGGQMLPAGLWRSVAFPLIRETNINVEQSIVRLLLPESKQWFAFAGTMRLVKEEGELAETYQSYLYKRIQEAAQALSSAGSDYTKVRAAVNLKQSKFFFDTQARSASEGPGSGMSTNLSDAAQRQALANAAILERAEGQVQQQLSAPQDQLADNRVRLNEYYNQQDFARSKNVVSELASNFDGGIPPTQARSASEGSVAADALNRSWFAQNGLRIDADDKSGKPAAADKPDSAIAGEIRGRGSRVLRGGTMAGEKDELAGLQQQGQAPAPNAPAVAGREVFEDLLEQRKKYKAQDFGRIAGGEESELRRYQSQLESNLGATADGSRQSADSDRARAGGYGLGGLGGGLPAGGAGGSMGGRAGEPGTGRQSELQFGLQTPRLAVTESDDREQLARLSAGLASLDVRLPERGQLYRFTTPRGNVAITARAVTRRTASQATVLALLAGAAALGWLLTRESSRQILHAAAHSTIIGIGLVILGAASICAGILPVVGLLLVGLGLFIAIRSRLILSFPGSRLGTH